MMLGLTRRTVLAAAPLAACTSATLAGAPSSRWRDALTRLERSPTARLGACILDTGTGVMIGSRLEERFALCSTFKMPLAAAVLRAIDRGFLAANQIVPYTQADIVPHHPVTGPNLAKGGMAVVALAEAAQKTSDNVAANLLMRLLGGPSAMTAFFRDLGDAESRLDRYEPTMNLVASGDPRDTTTPSAMAHTTRAIFTTDVLSPPSRALLVRWMIETDTGLKRIRAGLPKDWRVGDKTGTRLGDTLNSHYNDVAIASPPGRPSPLVITAYYDAGAAVDAMRDEDQAVLASVGAVATQWVTQT